MQTTAEIEKMYPSSKKRYTIPASAFDNIFPKKSETELIWSRVRSGIDFDANGPSVEDLFKDGFTETGLVDSGIWQRARGGRLVRTFGGFLQQCYERMSMTENSRSTVVLDAATMAWNHGDRTVRTAVKLCKQKRGG